MTCQPCNDEAIKAYTQQAKREAEEMEIKGFIVILERVNGSGWFWTTPDDDRCERLKVIDRIWIGM